MCNKQNNLKGGVAWLLGALCISVISFGQESSLSGQDSINVLFSCSCIHESCAYKGRHNDMKFLLWFNQRSCPAGKNKSINYKLTLVNTGNLTVNEYLYARCSAYLPPRVNNNPGFKIYTFTPTQDYELICPNYNYLIHQFN